MRQVAEAGAGPTKRQEILYILSTIYRRLGGASPACPTPRTGNSHFAFAFRFRFVRACVRAKLCERGRDASSEAGGFGI